MQDTDYRRKKGKLSAGQEADDGQIKDKTIGRFTKHIEKDSPSHQKTEGGILK